MLTIPKLTTPFQIDLATVRALLQLPEPAPAPPRSPRSEEAGLGIPRIAHYDNPVNEIIGFPGAGH
jgi:hypothetical protein